MTRKVLLSLTVLGLLLSVDGWVGRHCQAQTVLETQVSAMSITGEVAKTPQGYIIRGKVPAEIFTILNPCPEQLGRYMGENRLVQIEVRIVSGDNVEIEKIDGNTYSPECK